MMVNPLFDEDIVTIEENPNSKANFYMASMILGLALIYVVWIWLK